jgi:hypothetical protein
MKWQCPQPERARQKGCLDIKEEGQCNRKEWSGITYFKKERLSAPVKAEVYCERIKAVLRED